MKQRFVTTLLAFASFLIFGTLLFAAGAPTLYYGRLQAVGMTTAQRLALVPPGAISTLNGTLIYDTTLGQLFSYTNGVWFAIGSGGGASGGAATNASLVNGTPGAVSLIGPGITTNGGGVFTISGGGGGGSATNAMPVFNPMNFGAFGDDPIHDDTLAVSNCIMAALVNGGVIAIDKGYRITSPIIITNSGSPLWWHNPIVFAGNANDIWNPAPKCYLHFDPPGTSNYLAMFQDLGMGVIGWHDLTVWESTTNHVPMFYTTGTTWQVDRSAFYSSVGFSNDVFILGGTTLAFDGTTNSYFQGYGTYFNNCWADSVGKVIWARAAANDINIDSFTVWASAGGYSAFDINGAPSVDCVVSIKDTIIEMCGYSHGVVLTNIIAANISGIGCWDSVIAQVGVLIGPGCSENIVNAYVNPGTYPAVLDISGNANEIHTNGTVYMTGNGGVVSKTLVTCDAQVTNFLFVNVITSPGTSGYYIPSNNLASWLYAPGQVVGVGLPALKLFGSSPFTSGTYYAYGSTGGGSTTAFYDLGNGNEEDSILGWVGNGKGLTNIPASGVSTNGAPAGVSVVTSSNGVSQWLALPPGGSGAKLNVENFGAVHNGLIFTNASISSNSYTLTISGQTVTSADIGKRVFVYGAGYTNNNGFNGFPTYDLESAISNVTGGTTIILSNKAGTTVSTAWGVYGTDDTAAVQAGINAASTNGTQWHFTNTTLFFPDGIYIVDGPLVNVGTNSTNYLNAQLTVPYVPYSGIYGPTIKLRGATRPGQTYAYNWNTMGANGAMIWSTLVQSTVTNARMFSTANLTNTAGSPPRSTPQTPFNNNCVDIENMSFRMPHNSPATVLDMTGANQTHIEHVLIDEGYYPYSSPATNTWGYIKDQNATAYASSAISLPNTSEGSVVVNDITVMDAFIGLNYGDDASMHNLLFFDCVYGMFSFNKGAGHNSHAHDVICAQCLNVIGCDRWGFSYSCDLELTGLDMENGYGSLPFNVLNSIIDDPDSLAGGSVEVEDNWGSAAPATPTIGAGCWSISVTPAYNGSGNPFTTWNLWTGKSYLTKQNFRAGIQSSYYRQTNFFGGAGDAGDFYFGPNDGAAYNWYFGGDNRAAMQPQVSRNGFDWYLSNQALGARTNLMHLDTNGNLTSELSIAAGGDVTAGNILHGTKGMDANGATISNSLVLWQTNIGGSGLIIAQTNGNSYTTLSMVNYDINSGGTNAATSWQWRVLNSSNNNNCTMSLEVNTPGAGDTNAFTLNPIARLVTWATWAWTNNAGFGVLNGQVYDYGETTINGGTTNNALGFVGNGLGITNIQSTNIAPNAGKFTNSFTASLNTNTYFLWGTNQIVTLSITPPVGTIYTFVMRNYNGSAVITNNGSVFTVPGTGTTTNSVNIGAWNSPSNTWTGAYDGSNW